MNVQYFLNYKKLQKRETEKERENVTSLSTTMFITIHFPYWTEFGV